MYQKQLIEKQQRDAILDSYTWRVVEGPPHCVWIPTHGYPAIVALITNFFKDATTGFSIESHRFEKDEAKKSEFLVVELKVNLSDKACADCDVLYPLFIKTRLGPQIFTDTWALTNRGYYECKVNDIKLYHCPWTFKILSGMGISKYLVSNQGVPEGGRIHVWILSQSNFVCLRWHKCDEAKKYRFIAALMNTLPCMDCPRAETCYEKWDVLEE